MNIDIKNIFWLVPSWKAGMKWYSLYKYLIGFIFKKYFKILDFIC